jgi:hypothetical protein
MILKDPGKLSLATNQRIWFPQSYYLESFLKKTTNHQITLPWKDTGFLTDVAK